MQTRARIHVRIGTVSWAQEGQARVGKICFTGARCGRGRRQYLSEEAAGSRRVYLITREAIVSCDILRSLRALRNWLSWSIGRSSWVGIQASHFLASSRGKSTGGPLPPNYDKLELRPSVSTCPIVQRTELVYRCSRRCPPDLTAWCWPMFMLAIYSKRLGEKRAIYSSINIHGQM
jgi:hypothetical protein